MVSFSVNGKPITVDVSPDTPLVLVLREHLGLTGTKFGCGATMCGACTVHVDGEPTYSCVTDVDVVEGSNVTTIEGLADASHPLIDAWVAEQVAQCGYCQSGQIMRAAALLQDNPAPSRTEILEHMSTNLCRCGTYNRIVKAVQRVGAEA